MAVSLNYPSPTTMGVGKLIVDNGSEMNGVPHLTFTDRRAPEPALPEPRRETKMAFAIPKAPALAMTNGDAFEAVRLKDMS